MHLHRLCSKLEGIKVLTLLWKDIYCPQCHIQRDKLCVHQAVFQGKTRVSTITYIYHPTHIFNPSSPTSILPSHPKQRYSTHNIHKHFTTYLRRSSNTAVTPFTQPYTTNTHYRLPYSPTNSRTSCQNPQNDHAFPNRFP